MLSPAIMELNTEIPQKTKSRATISSCYTASEYAPKSAYDRYAYDS
jgi:hypothetical protein